jgi:hypothetical protein
MEFKNNRQEYQRIQNAMAEDKQTYSASAFIAAFESKLRTLQAGSRPDRRELLALVAWRYRLLGRRKLKKIRGRAA